MKTLAQRVSERLDVEMHSSNRPNAERLAKLSEQFASLESKGHVQKDRFSAMPPTALHPLGSSNLQLM